jgi:transcriptional regulator with XRE-family HTH domain
MLRATNQLAQLVRRVNFRTVGWMDAVVDDTVGATNKLALRLGVRLRHRRRLERLTLKELALKAGRSESLLSKIENEKASPSLATLHKIASALGTNVADLLGPQGEASDVVIKSGSRPRISASEEDNPSRGVQIEPLIPYRDDRLLQADIYIISPGCGSDGHFQHEGEEMGYLLEGALELTVGNKTYSLEPGDSFVFRSESFHKFENTGETVAKVIWVNTPPTF